MASKEPGQGDVFPRGGSLSPGNLSRITFVFFANENGSRKCHWVIAWREWLTKKTNHGHRLAHSSTVSQQLWPGHVTFQGKAGVALRETRLDGRPELACPSISPPCSSASWYQSAAWIVILVASQVLGTVWNHLSQTPVFLGNPKLVFNTKNSH